MLEPHHLAKLFYSDHGLLQVNEKGQLRLSRKALLPEPTVEMPSAKQDANDQKTLASQKATDKSNPRRTVNSPKEGVNEEATEKLKDKTSDAVEDAAVLQKKVYKRLASSARDGPNVNKDKPKKSSNKVVTGVASEDGSTLVNGEAKIG